MIKYLAFLRGINISGKNSIKMSELSREMENCGFAEVKTYLNSGNIVFLSDSNDSNQLSNNLSLLIRQKFNLEIPIFVIEQNTIQRAVNNSPEWWGSPDKSIYDNMILIIPPLTLDEFYSEMGAINDAYEKEQRFENVVFWSFSLNDYRKTNWWSKTALVKCRDNLTIRTANTIKKLITM